MTEKIAANDILYSTFFETISDGMIVTDLDTGTILLANPAAAAIHGYSISVFPGMRIQKLIHPKSLPFFTDYGDVILRGGLFEMMAQHLRRDGTQISIEWRAVLIKYQGKNCALASIRDVSKRVLAEQQLQQRVGLRAHEQSTLLDISHALASTLELQPGLILEQLGILIKYTRAVIFTLTDSTLIAQAARGNQKVEDSIPFSVALNGNKALDTLFNGRHPIRIADLASKDPASKFLHQLFENDKSGLLDDVGSWMWVPLAVQNKIIGGIGLAHMDRNFFTTHDADLAMTIANQAAITLVNSELYENAKTLAAMQERQRLAQNLHDAVNQSLFSAGLIAEVLPRLWDRDQKAARNSLEDLRTLTRGALAEMRALLAELRPSTLTDSDLGELILLLSNAFTGRTSVPVDLKITGSVSLPAEVQVTLYRICQEALNNIARHANASNVKIDVLFSESRT